MSGDLVYILEHAMVPHKLPKYYYYYY